MTPPISASTADDLLAAVPRLTRAIATYHLREDLVTHVRKLAEHGWKPNDIRAFDATWGKVFAQSPAPGQVRFVLASAGRLAVRGFTPVRTRAWVDLLWTVRADGNWITRTRLYDDCLAFCRAVGFANCPNLEGDFVTAYQAAAHGDADAALALARLGIAFGGVGNYVSAANGDAGLAVLALEAGLTLAEIAERVAAGTMHREGLKMLGGLRRVSSGLRVEA